MCRFALDLHNLQEFKQITTNYPLSIKTKQISINKIYPFAVQIITVNGNSLVQIYFKKICIFRRSKAAINGCSLGKTNTKCCVVTHRFELDVTTWPLVWSMKVAVKWHRRKTDPSPPFCTNVPNARTRTSAPHALLLRHAKEIIDIVFKCTIRNNN